MKTVTGRFLLGLTIALVISTIALSNLLTAGSANAQGQDKEEIEEIVRQYILDHPEIIIQSIEQFMQAEQVASNKAIEDTARQYLPTLAQGVSGHAMGADLDKADVILVEFFDYNCGVCKRASNYVFDLVEKDPSLRLILQEHPVFHEKSEPISFASLATANTDDFVAFHRTLMNAQGIVTEERLPELAEEANISYMPIRARLSTEKSREDLRTKLDMSIEMGMSMGMRGTPGFIIASPDGSYIKVIPGFAPDEMMTYIAEAKKARG